MNIYNIVTDRIIKKLEEGILPWLKPWGGVNGKAFNRVSKKPYSFLNQMLLSKPGEHATFNQWQSLGGKIKKGAKSEIVTFYKACTFEEVDKNGEKIEKTVPLLRYIPVFHISQVEGVEPLDIEKVNDNDPIEEAENILNGYIKRENITLEHSASDEAYYSPFRDLIHLPLFEQFKNVEEYYSTFAHEIIHSTGAKSRLNRLSADAYFGNKDYSLEELVAEIGSVFILSRLGIDTNSSFKNSAAYIQGWLKVLKNDNKMIVNASAKAQKAVEFIFGDEEA